MATQTQYYNLDKPSYDEVADIEIINANMDKIDTQMRNNADGVNFAKCISSDAYDNSKSYAVGDYCIYDNKLYRCITAIESAEAFNIAKWEQTTVGKEVKQLNSNLKDVNKVIYLASSSDPIECIKSNWSNIANDKSFNLLVQTSARKYGAFGYKYGDNYGSCMIISFDNTYAPKMLFNNGGTWSAKTLSMSYSYRKRTDVTDINVGKLRAS